ncbi:sugar ABC transporter ATP-binding protein [Arthrobacter sp. AZCC_0090]|uniref:sugar ABC transporter ATP-binding protein n=1 Tax=Arthrobacter sp. AZCC_0090 TaxID=2735881 RepID=UPI00160977B8|nr:sugar ABC transporter ATP-binding protein [Arthrobacter sp. AZCC_0090]MBB6406776.1 ribose transport system ATP-binding protein [Arthrobacter sp. AZCC_0090]
MTQQVPPLLAVRGVTKSFPGVRALHNMHLELRRGEVLALVGENGAGKSTLMKLLSGLYVPDHGSFDLDGKPFVSNGPKHAQELGISIIHQEFNLMPDLTVAQNIFIGREPRRFGLLSEHALNRKAQDLFDRMRLQLNPRESVGRLTVAKQQMVEIAKALSHDSKVIIMDEPTAALNDAEVATLHDLIRGFISLETGVIYISHRMDELKLISQRITVIRDGEYVDTVGTAETSMKEVISLMVGREVSGEQRPTAATAGARTDVVLSVEGLATKALLRDVGFDLHRGEILGFAGLMGAGRTEVARALVGADRATFGNLRVRGADVDIPNPAVAAKLGIGYLSEDRKHLGLMLERDVKENIMLSSLTENSAGGFIKEGALRRTAEEFSKKLRIKTPSVHQLARNLSGGNQQKIVIAKWLVKDCDILIFDEPTRGIDVGAKEEIYKLLDELAAGGKAIIMISSELPEVLRMSHRIAVMSEGRITGFLNNAEATQENIMELATRRISAIPGAVTA